MPCNMQASLCAAVVRLKLELYRLPSSQPSAVLLDNYNALFWLTQVYEASSLAAPLRRADAQELTLGANLRVLSDADVGSTTVAAAVSLSGDLPDLPLGLHGDAAPYAKFVLPPLGVEELGSLLLYYRCGPRWQLCVPELAQTHHAMRLGHCCALVSLGSSG